MSVTSACPTCGKRFRFPDDSKVGKKIRCRECEEPFVVEPLGDSEKPTGKPKRAKTAGGLPPRTVGVKPKPKKKSRPKSEEESSKKRKSQKKKKSNFTGSPAFIGGISTLVLALLIGVPFLSSGDDKPMEPPASYTSFQHEINNAFKCEYPSNWKMESGGKSGSVVWARIEFEDVKIRIRSSMGASAIGDIASNMGGDILGGAGGVEFDESMAPIASVHEMMHDQYAQDYSGYQEQQPKKIETGFGDTRISEFTASGSWGSTVRGVRASMLGRDLQWTVICDCPEKDWAVCQPVFEHIVKSMSRG
ncbi:zinc ribbon domain-containing protein [Thalassoroseus pseudoceratinae]|uniref:hypothetical protein n=1 Tax=Thalassoroseus pseudoceratinae TaxID=2713176 RepID=UPI001421F33C|nr:hypothetical protein [Thalassoroseus pseudoceratinae]